MDAHEAPVPPAPAVWLRRALVLVALWSIPGVIQATAIYAASSLKGDPSTSLATILAWRVPEWQVWALATPLILWAGRRYPVTRAPWKTVPLHLALATVIAVADVTVFFELGRALEQEPFTDATLRAWLPVMLLKTAFFELLVYAAVLVADQAFAYRRRYREAAFARARLEARLAEAQLDALKQQLHPHFLFNTLNAISVLMRKGESAAAIRMVNGLGELLRRSLTSLRVDRVPLDEELDFVARYLDIETTRFPDRLRVVMEIEPEARRAAFPTMLLQPIVENALEHGIAPRVAGGTITIAARVAGGRLHVEVRDAGAGPAGAAAPREGHGVGLANVRTRLAQLYPGAHEVRLDRGADGAVATIELPFSEVDACAR